MIRVPDGPASGIVAELVAERTGSVVEQLQMENGSKAIYLHKSNDIQDALTVLRDLGCTFIERNGNIVVRHKGYPKSFTIGDRVRYTGPSLVAYARKLESWLHRDYKPLETIAKPAEPAAPAAPEPETIDIPAIMAPTAMTHLTIHTIHAPQTTGTPYYIVRAYETTTGAPKHQNKFTVHDTLEAARDNGIPKGLIRRGPQPGDDATIVESWV